MRSRFRMLLVIALVAGTVARASPAKDDWKKIEQLGKSTADLAAEQRGSSGEIFNNLNLLNFRLEDFVTKYPADARRWDAEVMKLQVVAQLAFQNGGAVDWVAQEAGFAAVMAALSAKADTKMTAQAGWFYARLRQVTVANAATTLPALGQEVEAYYDRNRGKVASARIALNVARVLSRVDAAKAESILAKIARDGDGDLPKEAESLLRLVQARRAPLALAFTAIDGTKVDLASLRGKVVLIDFWATWCGPCRQETASIVGIYQRWHPKGLEIIGVSLDELRGKLEDYTQQHHMTWPQYFDGNGWDNKLAARFGIHSIPAMWLVNKQGYLVDVEGRDELYEKVERLLAE